MKSSAAILLIASLAFTLGADCASAQTLYGVDQNSGNLYQISTANGSLNLVGNAVASLGSLEYRPSNGMLYGMTLGNSSVLYRINPLTGQATIVGGTGEFVFEGGLVIAPDGTAYATNKGSAVTPILFKINLDTAVTTDVAQISGGSHDINGLAWRSDNMLVGLDRETNSLLSINPVTGASAVIAAVPTTIGGSGGMASIGDTGFYSTGGPSGVAGSNRLYSFNLFTGASTEIGSFSSTIFGNGISGLALIPVPEPSAAMLLVVAACFIAGRRKSVPHNRV